MERPSVNTGDRVRVYKNLTTGKWSITVKVPGKGWRLSRHADTVVILNAVPHCSTAGAARIRRTRSREVVARIEGTLVNVDASTCSGTPIRYNPFRSDHFTTPDGDTFTGCREAHFPLKAGHFEAIQ